MSVSCLGNNFFAVKFYVAGVIGVPFPASPVLSRGISTIVERPKTFGPSHCKPSFEKDKVVFEYFLLEELEEEKLRQNIK